MLASYQKPINDTRMYEKFGLSLLNSGKYKVIIVGRPAQTTPTEEIQFIPKFKFTRNGFSRLIAWISLLKLLREFQPSVVIISSWELLPALAFYRCEKKVYDIRENYIKNTEFNSRSMRWIKIGVVKLYERFRTHADIFLISDESYRSELSLNTNQAVLIRNSYKTPAFHHQRSSGSTFLFSGTLSKAYGVYRAIEIVRKLHTNDPSVRLTIIGFCPVKKDRETLNKIAASTPWITLKGIDHLVDHELILKEIQISNYGIISYEHHDHILSCTPTRLYEYIGERLPILFTGHKDWKQLIDSVQGGIAINPKAFDPKEVLNLLRETEFFTRSIDHFLWVEDSKNLLRLF